MKLRNLLSLLLVFAFGVSEAQNTPPSRTRSGDGFTQVDNYVTALKRLGIPSGETPTLDASTSANNTAKLFFNTTDTALYVYREDLQEWLKVSADSEGGEVPNLQEVLAKGNSANNQDITQFRRLEFSNGSFLDGYGASIGESNLVDGYNSFAFGRGNNVSTAYSIAFGQANSVNPQPGYLFGRGLETNDFSNQSSLTAFGEYNIPKENLIFTIGNGISSNERSNAYELFINGESTQYGIASYADDYSDSYTDRSLVDKEYVDAIESPFNVIDVPQQAYSDKAINVKSFDNSAYGMTYQEGAIDFGVSRDGIHQMGLYSFKAGLETEASGSGSVALGVSSAASGAQSVALRGTASGTQSVALGGTASGTQSVALGGTASGDFSFALGGTASGTQSVAFPQTESSGYGSLSQGINTLASGYTSISLGSSNISNEYASLAIGKNSTGGAAQSIWIDGSPIFKVGNGPSDSDRKNAYTLYNDGRSEQEKDMEVTEIGQGFVSKSPDGTRYRITVENGGVLTVTEL